jgi:hypothetical protein
MQKFNFLKEILKPHIQYKDFQDFVIENILPILERREYDKEIFNNVLNNIQKKYNGNLVSFEKVQAEILLSDFCENIEFTSILDGEDMGEIQNVDFGIEFKELINNREFKILYEDRFEENFSVVNIQF